jgi:hypothetical protein
MSASEFDIHRGCRYLTPVFIAGQKLRLRYAYDFRDQEDPHERYHAGTALRA